MLERTKSFAMQVVRLVASLPNDNVANVLGRQCLKSGTSVGANYREALHASSKKHFITTLEIVQREAEETLYWLDLIADAKLTDPGRLATARRECGELLAIVTASIRTARKNNQQ